MSAPAQFERSPIRIMNGVTIMHQQQQQQYDEDQSSNEKLKMHGTAKHVARRPSSVAS